MSGYNPNVQMLTPEEQLRMLELETKFSNGVRLSRSEAKEYEDLVNLKIRLKRASR